MWYEKWRQENRNILIEVQPHENIICRSAGRRRRWLKIVLQSYFGIDLSTMIVVIRERIVNGCQADMRIVGEQVVRREPVMKDVGHNCSHRNARACYAGTSSANGKIRFYIRMQHLRHVATVPEG